MVETTRHTSAASHGPKRAGCVVVSQGATAVGLAVRGLRLLPVIPRPLPPQGRNRAVTQDDLSKVAIIYSLLVYDR